MVSSNFNGFFLFTQFRQNKYLHFIFIQSAMVLEALTYPFELNFPPSIVIMMLATTVQFTIFYFPLYFFSFQINDCVKWGSVGMNAGLIMMMNRRQTHSTSAMH